MLEKLGKEPIGQTEAELQTGLDLDFNEDEIPLGFEGRIRAFKEKYKINPICKLTLRNRIWYINGFPMEEWFKERDDIATRIGSTYPELLVKERGAGYGEGWYEQKEI